VSANALTVRDARDRVVEREVRRHHLCRRIRVVVSGDLVLVEVVRREGVGRIAKYANVLRVRLHRAAPGVPVV
ncbi:hypothetical protein, partial [Escherichia coli]|uniref:hypothetical protein n=1 Tax=Escherichia coli TaxID=562 RepID=UPI003CE5A138